MEVCRRSFIAGIGASIALCAGQSIAAGMKYHPLRRAGQFELEPAESFIAANAFVEGEYIGAYRLGVCSWNFTKHFLRTVESPQEAASISSWTLAYASNDEALLDSLQSVGEEPLLPLSHIYRLLKLADPGQGPAQSSFAYVREPAARQIWALHWGLNHSREWVIGAGEVPHPHVAWKAGSKLFSSRTQNGRDIRHQDGA